MELTMIKETGWNHHTQAFNRQKIEVQPLKLVFQLVSTIQEQLLTFKKEI